MTTHFSFLNTLQGGYDGKIIPTDTDRYVFNCRRSRVFRSDGKTPGYVARVNDFQSHHANITGLDSDQLHPDTLAFWEKIKATLKAADQDGRIAWAFQESGQPNFDFNDRLRQDRKTDNKAMFS